MQTLAKLRRASGAGYGAIAKELGISPATARVWVMGVERPTGETLRGKILAAFQPEMTAREVADAVGAPNLEYVRSVLRASGERPRTERKTMVRDQVVLRKKALAILREHGFNDNDVAVLLGVSHQRAAQLRGDAPPVGDSRVTTLDEPTSNPKL